MEKIIQILTNTNCNLNCTYCYEQDKICEINDINDIKTFLNIQLCNLNNENIIIDLIGGETFLYPKLINEIIHYTNQININNKIIFKITTNGTLIHKDKEIQNIFLNNENLKVDLSIDGLKEIHDLNRKYLNGKGSYDDIIKSIEWLKENKQFHKVSAKATFNHKTIHQYTNSIIHLINLGFKNINPNLVAEEKWDLEKDVYIIFRQLINIIDYINYNKITDVNLFQISDKIDYEKLNFNNKTKSWCGSCRNIICLGFNNILYGCNRFCTNTNINLGYIKDDNIIIENIELIKEVQNEYNLYPEECKKCDILNFCPNCIVLSYEYKNYLNNKNMCGWTYALMLSKFYV